MQATKQLIAATLLAFVGVSAMAGDYVSPATLGKSVRSREAVVAEVQNLQSQHKLALGGDVVHADNEPTIASTGTVLTRSDVVGQVVTARATKSLPRTGDLL